MKLYIRKGLSLGKKAIPLNLNLNLNNELKYINRYQFIYVTKHKNEYDIDKIITKKIMVHLQGFFNKKFQLKIKHKNYSSKMNNVTNISSSSSSSSNKSKKNKTVKNHRGNL